VHCIINRGYRWARRAPSIYLEVSARTLYAARSNGALRRDSLNAPPRRRATRDVVLSVPTPVLSLGLVFGI